VLPELLRRDVVPDVLTDQTSAHDALNGYVPGGMSFADAQLLRDRRPDEYIEHSQQSMARHVEAMREHRLHMSTSSIRSNRWHGMWRRCSRCDSAVP